MSKRKRKKRRKKLLPKSSARHPLPPEFALGYLAPRFDSGYNIERRSLLEEFPPYFSAMLGSTVDTSLRQIAEAGFPGYDAPRAVFLSCPQAPDACHHGVFSEVAVPCRSSPCAGSRLLSGLRQSRSHSAERQSCSHGCTVVAFVLRSSSSTR